MYYVGYQTKTCSFTATKLEIIDKIEKGQSAKSLAIDYNVREQTIWDIKKKKSDLMKLTKL